MTKRKNHSPDFKAKVALEAIREEMTMAELSKKYGVHPTQMGTWKRVAIKNMAAGFSKRGGDPAQADDATIDKLHSKIGHPDPVRLPFAGGQAGVWRLIFFCVGGGIKLVPTLVPIAVNARKPRSDKCCTMHIST